MRNNERLVELTAELRTRGWDAEYISLATDENGVALVAIEPRAERDLALAQSLELTLVHQSDRPDLLWIPVWRNTTEDEMEILDSPFLQATQPEPCCVLPQPA